MFTIKNEQVNEYVINKSKFISFSYKIKNEDDAIKKINELKKIYKDATHICYAFITGNTKSFNDDKEPGRTAGMPILNVLENKKLNDILIVVVRYFGGIKLGAGGLVRAYSKSASLVIDKSDIIPLIKEYKIRIEFSYDEVNNINYILRDYKITYKEFDTNIVYEFTYEENNYPKKLDNYIIKKTDI